MQFYGKLQADGRIEGFESVILSAHGGDLNGFTMLKGSARKLDEIREDGGFTDIIVEAAYCTEGFGVVPGFIDEGLANVLSRWSKLFSG